MKTVDVKGIDREKKRFKFNPRGKVKQFTKEELKEHKREYDRRKRGKFHLCGMLTVKGLPCQQHVCQGQLCKHHQPKAPLVQHGSQGYSILVDTETYPSDPKNDNDYDKFENQQRTFVRPEQHLEDNTMYRMDISLTTKK